GGDVGGPAVSATPQPPQNFSPGWFEAPHEAQIAASTAPHSAQYRRSARLSWSQDGHRIAYRLACGDYHERRECQNEQQSSSPRIRHFPRSSMTRIALPSLRGSVRAATISTTTTRPSAL